MWKQASVPRHSFWMQSHGHKVVSRTIIHLLSRRDLSTPLPAGISGSGPLCDWAAIPNYCLLFQASISSQNVSSVLSNQWMETSNIPGKQISTHSSEMSIVNNVFVKNACQGKKLHREQSIIPCGELNRQKEKNPIGHGTAADFPSCYMIDKCAKHKSKCSSLSYWKWLWSEGETLPCTCPGMWLHWYLGLKPLLSFLSLVYLIAWERYI